MKLMLTDARTKEVREIEPARLGMAKWDVYEGRRLIHVEIKTGTATDIVPLEESPQTFVEQLMVAAPGAEGIVQFSSDAAGGLIRRALSYAAFGSGWSDARIDAYLKYLMEELRQLRMGQMKSYSVVAPTIPKKS